MHMLVILIIFSLIVHCTWHKKNTLECLSEMFSRDCKKNKKTKVVLRGLKISQLEMLFRVTLKKIK